MPEIRIINPAELIRETGERLLQDLPLYNQPGYCDLIKPGKLRFGRMESADGLFFFPLTTDRLFLRRRVFMLPFCQRFQPFGTDGEFPPAEKLNLWLNWLTKNTSGCHWAFSAPYPVQGTREKINQFLPMKPVSEKPQDSWKKGRKAALQKSENLEVRLLAHNEFLSSQRTLQESHSLRGWKPGRVEIKALSRISASLDFEKKICRYGVFEENKCLSLVLLLRWENRWHYLYSQSSDAGFEKESLTRFFHSFLGSHSGSGEIFDFEGSSIPGVRSFFSSFGALEECFAEFRK